MKLHHALVLTALVACASHVSAQEQPAASAGDDVSARAEEARLANRPDVAIPLYRTALATRPAWAEGWWHLGMLLYDQDDYAEAANAFERSTSIDPSVGTTWVMLGLCEYKLGRNELALDHIRKGRQLGTSADPQFRQVMLYHEGLLWLEKREFERAQETFGLLSVDGVESDDLTTALGLSALRLRPADVSAGDDRQLVSRAGFAEHLAAQKKFDEAEREYQRLAADFPQTKNVHYALGRYFVATQHPDEAVAAYEREIEITPDHVPARLGIAAIKAETDPAAALRHAEEAVRLNPRIPLGHYLLGSLLLTTDQTGRAISELEEAERSVKDDPGVYYALGRAYARAGRRVDAERARATFKRLTEQRQRAARQEAEDDTPQ